MRHTPSGELAASIRTRSSLSLEAQPGQVPELHIFLAFLKMI